MPTRKDQLFSAQKKPAGARMVIPATVQYRHDKKKGAILPLKAEEKMICALRKALAKFSDDSGGKRYYIIGNKIEMISMPVSTGGKEGEAQTYTASGRCKVGVAHPGDHVTSMMIEFKITFRDTTDELGLADVIFLDPTTIDALPKNTPHNMGALA